MNTGNEIRCYDYVNHAYEQVRDALIKDPLGTFQSATRAAASRAQSVAGTTDGCRRDRPGSGSRNFGEKGGGEAGGGDVEPTDALASGMAGGEAPALGNNVLTLRASTQTAPFPAWPNRARPLCRTFSVTAVHIKGWRRVCSR